MKLASSFNVITACKSLPIKAAGLLFFVLSTLGSTQTSTPWDAPAAQLADQIAALLGPSQASLALVNRSAIASSDLPAIRNAIDDALRSRGVQSGGAESANSIRIVLSENAHERLWIAQVSEASQTEVTMVRVAGHAPIAPPAEGGVTLQRKRLWASTDDQGDTEAVTTPVLAALELHGELMLLMQDRLMIFDRAAASQDGKWSVKQRLSIAIRTEARPPLPRDPRGELLPSPDGSTIDGSSFNAYLPGVKCAATLSPPPATAEQSPQWTLSCNTSDDPWPLAASRSTAQRAFYNAARNYFTGVVTPGYGVDLAPFYNAATLPQSSAAQDAQEPTPLLASAIDGKFLIIAHGAMHPVIGARDWGSDFAILSTGCGSAQILTTASGEAARDSLRAYELHGQEAVSVSAPLELDGSVMALNLAADSTSALAVVRSGQHDYEVERVTAVCP